MLLKNFINNLTSDECDQIIQDYVRLSEKGYIEDCFLKEKVEEYIKHEVVIDSRVFLVWVYDLVNVCLLKRYNELKNLETLAKESLTQEYVEKQRIANFKKGDVVKVTRIANSYENGWGNTWIKPMDDLVGNTVEVLGYSLEEKYGILVKNNIIYSTKICLPYFILEKVE
jgi:hypothetical protein